MSFIYGFIYCSEKFIEMCRLFMVLFIVPIILSKNVIIYRFYIWLGVWGLGPWGWGVRGGNEVLKTEPLNFEN